MSVEMSVDADHVIHLICKHLIDPPISTVRVRYASVWMQGTVAASL